MAVIFVPKNWHNAETALGGGDESTLLDAAALEDLERRVTDYADTGSRGGIISAKEYGAVADGALHVLSEFFSSLLMAQVMFPLATALTQSIDFCAVQEVMRRVNDAEKGTVYAPAGRYWMDGELDYVPLIPIGLIGDDGTVFEYPDDLGAGKFPIKPIYPSGFPTNALTEARALRIRNIEFYGPGGEVGPDPGDFPEPETPLVDMAGPRLERWCEMHDCKVEGFRSYCNFYGNHQKVWNGDGRNNHDNIVWEDIPLGDDMAGGRQYGHQQVLGGSMMRAHAANFYIGNNNGWVDVLIHGVQLGFAPWDYRRPANLEGGKFMLQSEVRSCNHESVGNGQIFCPDMNSAIDIIESVEWGACEVSSGTPGPDATAPSKGYNNDYKLADRNETKRITITGASGGTVTLAVNGQDIVLNHNANTGAVDSAFEAVLGAGTITATGGPLNTSPVTIEFTGALASHNIGFVNVTSSLTGGGTCTVTTLKHGINQRFTVVAGMMEKCSFSTGSTWIAYPGIDGVVHTKQPIDNDFHVDEILDAFEDPGGDTGTYGTNRPFFVPYTLTGPLSTNVEWASNIFYAHGLTLRSGHAQETIAAGDVVGSSATSPTNQVFKSTTTRGVVGVAYQDATATDRFLIVTDGDHSTAVTGTVAVGDLLKADPGAAGKAIVTVAPNGRPFAKALSTNASGFATLRVMCEGNLIPAWPPHGTVASASTITLPPGASTVTVTGTTNITSITTGEAGREVKLFFTGSLTVTAGSNLKMNGNFTATADDCLEFGSDGTNWIESNRSSNS